MIVTIFLIVMIVALFLGNAFLALTKPEPKERNGFSMVKDEYFDDDDDEEALITSPPGRNYTPPAVNFADSSLKALNQKVVMAHMRLDKIESAVLQIAKGSSGIDNESNLKLAKKLDSLINFKDSSRIEIQALKDRVIELEKRNNISPKIRNDEETEELKEKIHNIVYRGGKE